MAAAILLLLEQMRREKEAELARQATESIKAQFYPQTHHSAGMTTLHRPDGEYIPIRLWGNGTRSE